MTSAPLRLFPNVPAERPLKSALKKPRVSRAKSPEGDLNLKGVTLQVISNVEQQSNVNPASNTVRHSLLCDPSPEILASISKENSDHTPANSTVSSPKESAHRETRLRRPRSGSATSPLTGNEISVASADDIQSPKSQSSNNAIPTAHKRRRSRSKPFKIPQPLSTGTNTQTTRSPLNSLGEDDQLSPLPTKTHFTPKTRRPSASPSSGSSRSMQSSSPATSVRSSPFSSPAPSKDTPPMRSMFPQYDHSKALNQQQYFPRSYNQVVATRSQDVRTGYGTPSEKKTLKRLDSAVGLVDGYEHVPAAGLSDMLDIWNGSCDDLSNKGRKVQLSLHQYTGQGTALAVGRKADEMLYSIDRIHTQSMQQHPSQPKEMAVKKYHPSQQSSLPVAHLILPDRTLIHTANRPLASIFPQSAAIDAIEALITTPKAKEVMSLDATARSPTAAQFAHEAIAAAQQRYACNLVRKARKRDSLGSVTAAYELRHPSLGTFVINVTKSYSPTSPTVPRAKISLHHPSATPTAIAAETLNLAFLDFARDACVFDLPGLLALDGDYVIDTVVTALLAVAVIENDTLVAESLVFDAPPKVAIMAGKKKHETDGTAAKDEGSKAGRFSRRRGRKNKNKNKGKDPPIMEGEQVELPALTHGALALLGFSLKAAVLLLNAGVKVTAGVVVGVSNVAKKL